MTPAFKWILVFLATIVGVALCTSASADVLRGDKGSCSHFSTIVQGFGDYRDGGMPWEVIEPTWAQMVGDAMASETSYVRNAADAEWVTQKAKGLWDTKDPAILYAANVYEECMQVPKMKRKVLL